MTTLLRLSESNDFNESLFLAIERYLDLSDSSNSETRSSSTEYDFFKSFSTLVETEEILSSDWSFIRIVIFLKISSIVEFLTESEDFNESAMFSETS